jgi:predicted dehydrogenase/dTDP-4-amino-4,6-dideoxygalactose transaminase
LRIGIAAALNHDGLEQGGEIVVPNISFIASANAALDRRIGVALVDVDPKTLNVDPARVEEAIVPGKTTAIMGVHLFGQPADMMSLRGLAKKYSLALIEDAAQAHGAIHVLGRSGSLGDVAAFSFQSFKNLPAGEGGALTTSNSAIFERAYGLHNVGRKLVGGTRWGHETLGWNCRPTEYVAAVLLHRLKSFESQQRIRWERFQLLRKLLEGLSSVECLGLGAGLVRHGVHMFVMRYRKAGCGGLELGDFIKTLEAEGLPIGRAYEKTLAQQPVMQNIGSKRPEYVRFCETPVADQAVKELLFLPHNLFLASEEEITEVAAAFHKVETYYTGHKTSYLAAPKQKDLTRQRDQSAPSIISVTLPGTTCLRVGIVGAGFMGVQHAKALSKSGRFKIIGFSDVERKTASRAAAEYGCAAFDRAEELLGRDDMDVAVIATPHWQHGDMAGFALQNNLHVICEKPLTVTVEQADRLLALATQPQKLFAVVHQTRFEPCYQYVKTLLNNGELGSIYRCSIVESAWRTDAYYKSSPWRGTWEGEGGGVLLNQAPHVLDRYPWLCGMPTSVLGKCDTNLHPIEVEDTVSAIFRHENGMHGFLHVNTVESPPTSEMVICCDRGRIIIDRGRVRVTRLNSSIRDASRRETRSWGELQGETRELEFPFGDALDSLLVDFYNNFADAVAGRSDLVCPGRDGRDAVELANAIVLSSAERRELDLPLDRAAYSGFIEAKLGLVKASR